MQKSAHVLKKFEPGKTAILVIDKQAAYMDEAFLASRKKHNAPDFDERLAAIEDFIEYARQKGLLIVWTQMIESKDGSPPNIKEKLEWDETPDIAKHNDASFDIFGKVKPHKKEKVVTKRHYDAFANTDLQDFLQANGIESLVIIGGLSSRCVMATAFGANGRGYRMIIPEDLIFVPHENTKEQQAAITVINDILGYTTHSIVLKDFWKN